MCSIARRNEFHHEQFERSVNRELYESNISSATVNLCSQIWDNSCLVCNLGCAVGVVCHVGKVGTSSIVAGGLVDLAVQALGEEASLAVGAAQGHDVDDLQV